MALYPDRHSDRNSVFHREFTMNRFNINRVVISCEDVEK